MSQAQVKSTRGRPPRSGRSKSESEQALVRSGLAYFTEYGFTSAGLDKILKQVGVPKGSFYYYFKNKEDFGLAVIAAYDCYFMNKLQTHFSSDKDPVSQLTQFAEDAKQGIQRHQYRRGCLVGNLEQEIAQLPESFRTALKQTLENWEQQVAKLLLKTASVHSEQQAKQLAQSFWIGWEGAVSRCKLDQSTQPIDRFLEHFLQLIKH